ncbi:MAG TPA: response regulator [Pseudomonadota bacterium]|nr:response regulator [Pseudomonadota bacterium]
MAIRPIKVVVVDDSEFVLEITKHELEAQGLEVFTVNSPIGFSQLLRDRKPDIALVDVSMPALQGPQLISIAHRHGATNICPVVLFSDRSRSELEQLASMCGAAGVIRKSDDWEGIALEIRRILGRHPRPSH